MQPSVQFPGKRAPGWEPARHRSLTRSHSRQVSEPLLQPLQATFAQGYVLVVPLNISRLGKPTPQILCVDLIGRSVSRLRGFERAFLLEDFLRKGLTAPEEQTDAAFQLAVPHDRIAFEKPCRMTMPYLVFRFR